MAFENDELNKRRQERRQEQRFMAKQQKLLKIGIVVTAVTLVLCAAALLIARGMLPQPQLSQPSTDATSLPESQPTETQPLPTEPDTVIHFVAGGDLNVTDKTVASGIAVNGYDYTDTFLDVAPIFAGADLSVVNFEGSLYGAPYGTVNHSAPIEMVQALQKAGVDMLQAANSMTVQNGLSGFHTTLQGIRSAGLEPLGAYATAQEFKNSGGFTLWEIQGIRVAIVAFTKGMDGSGLPAGSENCVNLLYEDYNSTYQKVDTEAITGVLSRVKKARPDVTIALLHWGSEFNNQVSKTQEKIRDLMLENGVDAIIGTHSHYVQKVDFDREKGTLVAYSLGDFLSDGEKAGTDYSVLLDLQITKSRATGEVSITGFDYVPVYIDGSKETAVKLRVLRIREAMEAYEQNFVGKVSEETYLAMKSALEKVDSRMHPQ